jgi:hypothetical protein
MAANPVCLVCQVAMEIGFMTDSGYGTINLPRWCEGSPESSVWTGEVKSAQLAKGLKVVAYRCPKCEALRLYAPSGSTH